MAFSVLAHSLVGSRSPIVIGTPLDLASRYNRRFSGSVHVALGSSTPRRCAKRRALSGITSGAACRTLPTPLASPELSAWPPAPAMAPIPALSTVPFFSFEVTGLSAPCTAPITPAPLRVLARGPMPIDASISGVKCPTIPGVVASKSASRMAARSISS